MSDDTSPKRRIGAMLARRVAIAVPMLLVLLFLPAGTFAYWEAWALLAVLLVPGAAALVYLVRHDRALLERRLKSSEPEPRQRLLMRLATAAILVSVIVAGLDRRFGWSDLPAWLVFLADALVLSGYGIFHVVIRANPWASRVVEIESRQQVVTTGPYAVVRHPMYVGTLLIYLAAPLALGSWWGLVPATLLVPTIAARILNEESLLARDLEGYADYATRVRWRLVPGVW